MEELNSPICLYRSKFNSANRMAIEDKSEEVQLLRGGLVVSSFAGAFGASLRETRLTAILGYLIALKPKVFCDEFGITGTVESVRLEARYNQGRSDILINSTDGLAVVEAKVDATDPFKQAKKYHHAKWLVLLTQYLPTPSQKKNPRIKYLCWREVAELIQRNTFDFSRGKERFISRDLINYLKEHNMIPNDEDKIINVRDITDVEFGRVFFEGTHLRLFSQKKQSAIRSTLFCALFLQEHLNRSRPARRSKLYFKDSKGWICRHSGWFAWQSKTMLGKTMVSRESLIISR